MSYQIGEHMGYLDDATDVDELIFQAIGAASVMWGHPERAGIFQGQEAHKLGIELMDRLGEAYGKA